MDVLSKTFLEETVLDLEKLMSGFTIENWTEPSQLEKTFRQMHSIKGTSATFGFSVQSHFAHEIENLLQKIIERKDFADDRVTTVFNESLVVLKQMFEKTLQGEKTEIPHDISAKINYLLETEDTNEDITFPKDFPKHLINQLSKAETVKLNNALIAKHQVLLFEIYFGRDKFEEAFKELRQKLEALGEVIANFPIFNFQDQAKIGFQILFTTAEEPIRCVTLINFAKGKVVYQTTQDEIVYYDGKNLSQIIEQAIAGGKNTANLLGKEVKFEVFGKDIEISNSQISIISKVLPHLVRNAIDHGIESPTERISNLKSAQGIVTIAFSNDSSQFCLAIKDDGRGIDTEKVLQSALSKNLISKDEKINPEQIWQLVFKSGLSTANQVSEISGRGIGLDAVEEVVKEAKGTIRIHSEMGLGTIFELKLPNA
ncbi:MAG: ATP-binding protein [Pyrinomonadaceae bacterium]|nr:ATP-binding protein [Pyrinomonadaceae bacterium]